VNWERVKLSDVVLINPRPTQLNDDETISFVPMSSVSDTSQRITAEEERAYVDVKKGYTAFSRGDILLAKITPCFENGKLAIAEIENQNGYGSTEFHVIRVDKQRLDIRYLYHFLRQKKILIEGEKKMTGSAGQRRVPKSFLEFLQIPLPPLPIQHRIAAVLDEVDLLRRKRERGVLAIDKLAAATFQEIFGDVVKNTRGFEIYRFGAIATARLGKMLDKNLQTSDEPKQYLRNINVQWDRLKIDELNTMTFTKAEMSKFSLLYGDLLVCEGGEVGRAAIWRDEIQDCYFQKALHRIRPDSEKVLSEYLLHYLWQMASRGGLKDFVTVATIAHLTGEKMALLPVPIPPMSEQIKFKTAYDEIREQQAAHSKALSELDSFAVSLQARAFAGELALRNLEPAY